MKYLQYLIEFRKFINSLLILVFLCHGLIYFFYPEDLHNTESPIKYIKYALLLFFIIINIDAVHIKNVLIVSSITIIYLFFVVVSNQYMFSNPALIINKYLPYIAPIYVLLILERIKNSKIYIIVTITFFITVVTGYIEFNVLQGIFREFIFTSEGQFRISSIFINPNNAGMMAGLLNLYIQQKLNRKNFLTYSYSIIVWGLSIMIIGYTSSKTGMSILILHILWYSFIWIYKILQHKYISKSILTFFLIGAFLCPMTIFLFFSKKNTQSRTREITLETGEIRAQQIIDFGDDLSNNFFFPFYRKDSFTIDNTYIQFWGDFSLFGFLPLLLVLLVAGIKIYYRSIREFFGFILFILCGFSLNFMYVWPLAYIFWYIVWKSFKAKILENE
jgi:hypothetical protein